MNKTIITQNAEVAVNYDTAVKLFYYRPCEVENMITGEISNAFAIFAEMMNDGSYNL